MLAFLKNNSAKKHPELLFSTSYLPAKMPLKSIKPLKIKLEIDKTNKKIEGSFFVLNSVYIFNFINI